MAQACSYLIHLQFLGFRYSGWQKQPGQKTVEGMLVKTLRFVLPGRQLKVLGAGRTDARVSALQAAFELFLEGEPLRDPQAFLGELNNNLPPDIRALDIRETVEGFNIINSCKEKEYLYFFAFGQKIHPFCAPFMTGTPELLNIELMAETALLYEGTHDFRAYTTSNGKQKQYVRTITTCRIEKNELLKANFFPQTSYMLCVRGQGFLRYQVRMIMGALLGLGKGELRITDIRESLKPGNEIVLTYVAPGSGLLLHRLNFN
jgi:tRNA pseudouridine38-40 synthase